MTHEAKDHDRAIGARDGRTAEEVIASIDSSGWAVDPVAHGMTAMEYERGEAEMIMSAFQQRADGVNTFFHFPGLTRFGDQWVVSVNNDTVYSMSVIDTRAGFSIELPDMGDRFVSLHIQDFNHAFVDYSWKSGTHCYAADAVDTDYVLAGLRIATTGTDEDEAFIRESLQPKTRIVAASAIPFEPHTDPDVTRRVREALLPQYQRLADTYGTVKYDTLRMPRAAIRRSSRVRIRPDLFAGIAFGKKRSSVRARHSALGFPDQAPSSSVAQKVRQERNQRLDPFIGDLPHEKVVDLGVAVNQHVAEGDDPGEVRDLPGEICIGV